MRRATAGPVCEALLAALAARSSGADFELAHPDVQLKVPRPVREHRPGLESQLTRS